MTSKTSDWLQMCFQILVRLYLMTYRTQVLLQNTWGLTWTSLELIAGLPTWLVSCSETPQIWYQNDLKDLRLEDCFKILKTYLDLGLSFIKILGIFDLWFASKLDSNLSQRTCDLSIALKYLKLVKSLDLLDLDLTQDTWDLGSSFIKVLEICDGH